MIRLCSGCSLNIFTSHDFGKSCTVHWVSQTHFVGYLSVEDFSDKFLINSPSLGAYGSEWQSGCSLPSLSMSSHSPTLSPNPLTVFLMDVLRYPCRSGVDVAIVYFSWAVACVHNLAWCQLLFWEKAEGLRNRLRTKEGWSGSLFCYPSPSCKVISYKGPFLILCLSHGV